MFSTVDSAAVPDWARVPDCTWPAVRVGQCAREAEKQRDGGGVQFVMQIDHLRHTQTH